MDQLGLPAELLPLQLLEQHRLVLSAAEELQRRQAMHEQQQEQAGQQYLHAEDGQGEDDEDQELELSPAKPQKPPKTSRYTGVMVNPKNGKFRSSIKHEGRKVFLGNYSDEEEAARAFDRAAIKLRGPGTRTNFPVQVYGDIEALVAEGVQGLPPARPVGRPRKHPLPEPDAAAVGSAGGGGGDGGGGGSGSAGKKSGRKRKASSLGDVYELGAWEDEAAAAEEALDALLPPCKKTAGVYIIPPEAEVNNPALDAVRRAMDAALAAPVPAQALLDSGMGAAGLTEHAAKEITRAASLGALAVKQESGAPVLQLPKRKVGRPSNADRAAYAALEAAIAAATAAPPQTQDSTPSPLPAPLNALLLAASAADAGPSAAAAAAQRAAGLLLPTAATTGTPPSLLLSSPSPTPAPAPVPCPADPGPGVQIQLPAVPSSTVQHGRQKARARMAKHLPPGYTDPADVPYYKGVSWQEDKEKWRATLALPERKKQHIGYYESPEDAARAYDRAALQYHGAGTTTNFPLSDYLTPAQLEAAAAAGQLPDPNAPPRKRGRPPKPRPPQEVVDLAAEGAAAAGSAPVKAEASVAIRMSTVAAAYAAAAAAAAEQRQAATLAAMGKPSTATTAAAAATEAATETAAAAAAAPGPLAPVQYEGVAYLAKEGKYQAAVPDPADKRKKTSLGLFDSAEEAARACDRAVVQIQGTAAPTNLSLEQCMDGINAQLVASTGFPLAAASLPLPSTSTPPPAYMLTPTALPAPASTAPSSMDSMQAQLQELLAREQASRIKQTLQLTQLGLAQQQQAGLIPASAWDAVAAAVAAATAPLNAAPAANGAAPSGAAAAGEGTGTGGNGVGTPTGRQRSRKTPPAGGPASTGASTPPRAPLPALHFPGLPLTTAPEGQSSLGTGAGMPALGAAVPVPTLASAIPLHSSAAAAAAAAALQPVSSSVPLSLLTLLPQGLQLPALSPSTSAALGGRANAVPSPSIGFGFPLTLGQ